MQGQISVIFGVPDMGSVCSEKHTPSFKQHADQLRELGVEKIYCITVCQPEKAFAWAGDMGLADSKVRISISWQLCNNRILGTLVASSLHVSIKPCEFSKQCLQPSIYWCPATARCIFCHMKSLMGDPSGTSKCMKFLWQQLSASSLTNVLTYRLTCWWTRMLPSHAFLVSTWTCQRRAHHTHNGKYLECIASNSSAPHQVFSIYDKSCVFRLRLWPCTVRVNA